MPADSPAVLNAALQDIQSYLADCGQSLADFPPIPMPNYDALVHEQPQIIKEELCYDRDRQQATVQEGLPHLIEAQRQAYTAITDAMAAPAHEVRIACQVHSLAGRALKCVRWRHMSAFDSSSRAL